MERIKSFCQPKTLASLLATLFIFSVMAHPQTITVLHSFTNGADGSSPYAGVTLDRAGNLYGTTTGGANGNVGTVYKMTHARGGWILYTIYTFDHADDPGFASARVVLGRDGTLYGTGYYGGTSNKGAIFNLRPPATVCKSVSCPWTLTLLHSFIGIDGQGPYFGDLIFDAAGNIYGTTSGGGAFGQGTVFKLSRSGNSWTHTVLYNFTGGNDGASPENGVALDSAGNLYGTATYGAFEAYGTVYMLSPSGVETTLHQFSGGFDGGNPMGSVAVDNQGNLYGTTHVGGTGGAGTVWQLTPSGLTFTTLYTFSGYEGPFDTPTLDAAGNVYGTSSFTPGDGAGEVFKLTPSGGGWSYTSYAFGGNNGYVPIGGVTLDASGNLYGTTAAGGAYGWGNVWEITP